MSHEEPDSGKHKKNGPDPLRFKIDEGDLAASIQRMLKAGKPTPAKKKTKRKK